MNRFLVSALCLCLAILPAAGEDVVFHKSKRLGWQGRERNVDLIFMSQQGAIALREKKATLIVIPYTAISQVQYSYSVRHRVKEGGQLALQACTAGQVAVITCPTVGVIAAPIVMLTKQHSHWLYIHSTTAGIAEEASLKLDKYEYERIIATIKAHTGQDVAVLSGR
jgi:hypothetical protein